MTADTAPFLLTPRNQPASAGTPNTDPRQLRPNNTKELPSVGAADTKTTPGCRPLSAGPPEEQQHLVEMSPGQRDLNSGATTRASVAALGDAGDRRHCHQTSREPARRGPWSPLRGVPRSPEG